MKTFINEVSAWIKLAQTTSNGAVNAGDYVYINRINSPGQLYQVVSVDRAKSMAKVHVNGTDVAVPFKDLIKADQLHDLQEGDYVSYKNIYFVVSNNMLQMINRYTLQPIANRPPIKITPEIFQSIRRVPKFEINKIQFENISDQEHSVGDRVIVTDIQNRSFLGVINYIDANNNISITDTDGRKLKFQSNQIKSIKNYGSSTINPTNSRVYVKLDPKMKDRLNKVVSSIAPNVKNKDTLKFVNNVIDTLMNSIAEVDGYSKLYTTMNFGKLGSFNVPNRYVVAVRNINNSWAPTLHITDYVVNNNIKLPGLQAPRYQENNVSTVIQLLLSRTNKMMW